MYIRPPLGSGRRAAPVPSFLVPICGYVSAGYLEPVEDQPLGFVMVPLPHLSQDLFGLVVRGDSMVEAGIANGDIVLIRPQSTFPEGSIVVAAVDGHATLKRLYQQEGGYRLEPANAAYPPLFISAVRVPAPASSGYTIDPEAPDVRILGLMVGMLSGAVFPIETPPA